MQIYIYLSIYMSEKLPVGNRECIDPVAWAAEWQHGFAESQTGNIKWAGRDTSKHWQGKSVVIWGISEVLMKRRSTSRTQLDGPVGSQPWRVQYNFNKELIHNAARAAGRGRHPECIYRPGWCRSAGVCVFVAKGVWNLPLQSGFVLNHLLCVCVC